MLRKDRSGIIDGVFGGICYADTKKYVTIKQHLRCNINFRKESTRLSFQMDNPPDGAIFEP